MVPENEGFNSLLLSLALMQALQM